MTWCRPVLPPESWQDFVSRGRRFANNSSLLESAASERKKKEFIRLDGSTLVIRDRTALEALAA
jgi:hypothetical protein